MAASDNVLAGVYGGLQGVNDTLGTYVKYKLQSKLKHQEDYISGADIPEELRNQLGITPDQQINKDILKLYQPTTVFDSATGQMQSVSPFRTSKTPTVQQGKMPVTQSQARALAAAGKPLPLNSELIPDEKPSPEDQADAKSRAKLEASKPKAKIALRGALEEVDNYIADVDRLSKHPGLNMATGLTSFTSGIPGTSATDAAAELDSLKSKNAFSKLSDLRAQSPTGGALGQVSDREEEMLSNATANLNRKQSSAAVRENLSRLRSMAKRSRERLLQGYRDTYGEDFVSSTPTVNDSGGESDQNAATNPSGRKPLTAFYQQ